MKDARSTTPSPRRGFAMITAIFVMGILLIVAALLLDNVRAVAVNTQMLEQKNQIFDAAEAGLDSAIDFLDRNPTATSSWSCPGGTIHGYTFKCAVAVNNFKGATPAPATDPITGNSVTVPASEGLIWAKAASVLGGRTVSVEAIISNPVPFFQFPQGAINAQNDVTGGGHMPVNADPTDSVPNDANVHANRNVTDFTTIVQGLTYAVGTDSQPGYNGSTNSGAPPVPFPDGNFVSSFTSYTYDQAYNHGTIVDPSSLGGGNHTYSGNVYIGSASGTPGSGNLNLSNGTYTFNGGIVFVDGYLCLSGKAQIINNNNTVFVVRNQFAQAGNSSSYSIVSGTQGVLAVLGTNTAPPCPPANGPYAFNDSGNGSEDLGLVYTPNGSVNLSGNGNLSGSIDAGVNAVLSGGGSGGTFTYDHNLITAGISAPVNVKILSYGEYK